MTIASFLMLILYCASQHKNCSDRFYDVQPCRLIMYCDEKNAQLRGLIAEAEISYTTSKLTISVWASEGHLQEHD
jgi:hypothetical protein